MCVCVCVLTEKGHIMGGEAILVVAFCYQSAQSRDVFTLKNGTAQS